MKILHLVLIIIVVLIILALLSHYNVINSILALLMSLSLTVSTIIIVYFDTPQIQDKSCKCRK